MATITDSLLRAAHYSRTFQKLSEHGNEQATEGAGIYSQRHFNNLLSSKSNNF